MGEGEGGEQGRMGGEVEPGGDPGESRSSRWVSRTSQYGLALSSPCIGRPVAASTWTTGESRVDLDCTARPAA